MERAPKFFVDGPTYLTGPGPQDLWFAVTLNKTMPEGLVVSHDYGLVVCRSKPDGSRAKKASVVTWSAMVAHLRDLLEESPQARADVRAMLEALP